MHRLFVETDLLNEESPALPKDAARHLKVLRPKDGEEIELFDGKGKWRVYRFCASLKSGQETASPLSTTVLLETMAGKGSEVGRNFEEIRAIIDAAGLPLGVCLDTCHVWDGGYDIVNDLDGVLAEFDRIIGLERLKAIHLNDSMNAFSTHKDRHQKLGQGHLGTEALVRVVNHPQLRDLPFYLETPCDLQGYRDEISLVKEWRN